MVTDREKIASYDRMVEGGRKGGRAEKHFTPESKQHQIEGCRRGGSAPRHYTVDGKARQKAGAAKGGRNSRRGDVRL